MKIIALILCCLTLSACADDGRNAAGITDAEADALDDAAEMLDAQRLPDEAVRQPAPPSAAQGPKQQ